MRSYLVAFAALALAGSFPVSANAQYDWSSGNVQVQKPLNEAQKRRLLLPYVRSATDCFANTVRQRSDLADGYLAGRMRTFFADALSSCGEQVRTLANQHDLIYGPGTGNPFVTGPYFADLERAVLSRIKPEIDRQIAAAEQRRAEERARAEAAEAAQRRRVALLKDTEKMLISSAYECANSQLRRLMSSNERAEVLAEAAMTICSKEVKAAIDATYSVMQAENPAIRSTFETDELLRNAMRKGIQTNAVVMRAERNNPQPAPQPESGTAKATVSDENIRKCLTVANGVYSKKVNERAELIRSMIELCRPEIETHARNVFLESSTPTDLNDARTSSLKKAAEISESIAGTQH
jgi:hypothetical protein